MGMFDEKKSLFSVLRMTGVSPGVSRRLFTGRSVELPSTNLMRLLSGVCVRWLEV